MKTKKVKLSTLNEKRKELEALLNTGQKPIWKPDTEGETIYGIFENEKKIITQVGKKKISSYMITVNTGEKSLGIWRSTVLDTKFKELDIKPGDLVGIRYLGKRKKYINYDVAVIHE